MKLVATDLDGTLVRSDGTVSDYSRAVLADLDRRGVPVVIVTARPIRWMDDLWPIVGAHGLAIVSNGAAVVDRGRHEIRDVRGIDPAVGLRIIDEVRRAAPGASYAVECVAGLVRDERYLLEGDPVPVDSPVGDLAELWTEPGLKLLVRDRDHDPAAFRDRVMTAVGDAAIATWTVDGLVEISATGVTKATALERVAAELGVAAADVVAFGDMPNDLPMLTWAGRSYAMGNGHPDLIAAADHVAPTNDEDGVARVLTGLFSE